LKGREFVSTLEAKRYPITATQWHPEKPAFEFVGVEGMEIPHSQEAIAIGQHMAMNFVAKARQNAHRFTSLLAEEYALLDKLSTTVDPRHFFGQIYMIGIEGQHQYNEQSRDAHLVQYSETESLGLVGHDWLPMSIEVEMVECPWMASPVSKLLGAETVSMRSDSDVAKWLNLTGSIIQESLRQEPMSEVLLQRTSRVKQLRSFHVKDGHDDEGTLYQWNWEPEKSGKMELELSSPANLSEEDAKFAINLTKSFVGKFTGVQYSSFQSHVYASCLRSDDRIVGLLLLWEKFHNALHKLIQLRWRGPDFARNLSVGNPELLSSLQSRWANGTSEESLEDLFRSHEPDIRHLRGDRDGFRNFAVNVCHLLNINCCRNCPKNDVKKFGALEFRMFNTEFGSPMRLSIMLFQRMVQRSCNVPLAELRRMTLNLGGEPAADATDLFEFLGMDASAMQSAFFQSGAERYLWHCS